MSFFKFWVGILSLSFFRLHLGGSSASSTSSTTENADKRNAVQDGIGISGDSNRLSVAITDGGIVSRALQSVDLANANAGEGFAKLIETAGDIFDRGQGLIGQTQKAVADAYGQAQTDKAGTIDNRTLIALAAAAAAVVGLIFMTRKKA